MALIGNSVSNSLTETMIDSHISIHSVILVQQNLTVGSKDNIYIHKPPGI